ncbi:MAG: 1,4-alpha-glucan branching protein GlgB [Actinomycetota bacterium]|nr:1,4-alpha-glucan branching protein GlgB [Actinomycetota bacterium]
MAGLHSEPHRVLGMHNGVVRTRHPSATAVRLLLASGASIQMENEGEGLFAAQVPDAPSDRQDGESAKGGGDVISIDGATDGAEEAPYRFEATLADGSTSVYDDPYRLWPTLGDLDLHLFGEGRHRRPWDVLGAHHRVHQGVSGTAFAVWAPGARSVRVVGDWNGWDGRTHPMRSMGSSGVWEIFVPGVVPGARYKYEIQSGSGGVMLKADPMARQCEKPPATASIVPGPSAHRWTDGEWLRRRADVPWPGRERMSIYELHVASWRRVPEEGNRPLTYRELAEQLPDYVERLGFTHVEMMPLAAHPFEGSWGYQVSSYYAASPRYGSADDLKALVDALHAKGIGVILDWVPAHFPKDEWALARFDGTALYEHEDPRQGEQMDWGTLVFNLGRHEVRNFLTGNALYWIEEFHIDGLRVDAVASMLYLDYSRRQGEWVPNRFGGRENLEAVEFIRELNEVVPANCPGAITIAEESTAWPAVSRPTWLGGLGFSFKWNMGWMHDTLRYFSKESIHRRWHHNDLTFGLLYAFTENFVLPLSHDEVVHGKGSLLAKMPGDYWQQLANLRALYAWMWAHPGKKLLFMGGELAQGAEWNHAGSLDWHLLDQPGHRGMQSLVADLNHLSAEAPSLWREDFESEGFRWIDAADSDSNVISFMRFADGENRAAPGGKLACVANLSPVVRYGYRIGLPSAGTWKELLNTDASAYGGSGVGNMGSVVSEPVPWHGFEASAELTLPPLAVLWFVPSVGT